MITFANWRKRLERRRLVRTARDLAALIYTIGGPDLRRLSDDELIEHLTAACDRLSEAAELMAVPAEGAAYAFNALAQAFYCAQLQRWR